MKWIVLTDIHSGYSSIFIIFSDFSQRMFSSHLSLTQGYTIHYYWNDTTNSIFAIPPFQRAHISENDTKLIKISVSYGTSFLINEM